MSKSIHEDQYIYQTTRRTYLRKRTVRYCPIIIVPSRISLAKMVMIAPLNKLLMVVLALDAIDKERLL